MIIVRIINTYAFWDLSGQLNLVINIIFYLSVQISCSNFHLEENWVPFERNELIKIKFSAKIKCGLSNCLKKMFQLHGCGLRCSRLCKNLRNIRPPSFPSHQRWKLNFQNLSAHPVWNTNMTFTPKDLWMLLEWGVEAVIVTSKSPRKIFWLFL